MSDLKSVLVGAILAGAPLIIREIISNRAENKRHRNALIFDSAMKNWLKYAELVQHNSQNGEPQLLTPVEPYFFQTIKFFELFVDRGFKEEDFPRLYQEYLERTNKIMAVLDKHDPSSK